MCRSHEVEIVRDAGTVFNIGGKEIGGVWKKKGYIYSSFSDLLVQLVTYDNDDSYLVFG